MVWVCDATRFGGNGGGSAVNDWRKFDGEKSGRNSDDAVALLFEAAAAAEKYAARSNEGRNCWEKAWRRKSASSGDKVEVVRSD